MERIVLSAPDISCEHCVAAIEKAVGTLPGVAEVKATVDTKLVNIAYDPAQTSLDSIEATLAEEGYPAAKNR